ncbi:MAG: hypothetical protein PHQ98_03625 [Candidatus ainarchaeum sp.]|nr:hypothetical protein [Candidatus ainarchaeum sp.]
MSLGKNQIVGILVLISLVLLHVSVPLISGNQIASIILLLSGIYLIVIGK